MTVEFNDRDFRFSHGKAPRGYGSWAFEIEGTVHWAPTSTFADAKKWARQQVRALAPTGFAGHVTVTVCT